MELVATHLGLHCLFLDVLGVLALSLDQLRQRTLWLEPSGRYKR